MAFSEILHDLIDTAISRGNAQIEVHCDRDKNSIIGFMLIFRRINETRIQIEIHLAIFTHDFIFSLKKTPHPYRHSTHLRNIHINPHTGEILSMDVTNNTPIGGIITNVGDLIPSLSTPR